MIHLRPEHYFQAARERIEQAQILYSQPRSYSLAMYVAGLAVECLRRAFKARKNPAFDEKHDLHRLFKASGLGEMEETIPGLSKEQRETSRWTLRALINTMAILWSNTYRFAGEDRVRAHLKNNPLLRKGIKGDILKGNARRLLETARQFMEKGTSLWTSRPKLEDF